MNTTISIQNDTYLIGDIHGRMVTIIEQIKHKQLTKSSFILLGDVGMGFHEDNKHLLSYCDELLQASDNQFYLIRGNHDNPQCWRDSNWAPPLHNIHFVQDGQQFIIKDRLYIALGGAISVDRTQRILGRDYWAEEAFCPALEPIPNLQGVLAHTGPFAKGWGGIMSYIVRDMPLRDDLFKEQEDINATIRQLQPQQWFCGHFHCSESIRIENTQCRCLDIDEIIPLPDPEPEPEPEQED